MVNSQLWWFPFVEIKNVPTFDIDNLIKSLFQLLS